MELLNCRLLLVVVFAPQLVLITLSSTVRQLLREACKIRRPKSIKTSKASTATLDLNNENSRH